MITTISKVEIICLLFPLEDKKAVVELLKARPDLDTLFALYYKDLFKEQRINPLNLIVDFKTYKL